MVLFLPMLQSGHLSPKNRVSLHSTKRTGAKELGFRSRGTQGVNGFYRAVMPRELRNC